MIDEELKHLQYQQEGKGWFISEKGGDQDEGGLEEEWDHEGESFHRNGHYSSTEVPHSTGVEGTHDLTEFAFKEAARDFLHTSGNQQGGGEEGVLTGDTYDEGPLHRCLGPPFTIATSHPEDAPFAL